MVVTEASDAEHDRDDKEEETGTAGVINTPLDSSFGKVLSLPFPPPSSSSSELPAKSSSNKSPSPHSSSSSLWSRGMGRVSTAAPATPSPTNLFYY